MNKITLCGLALALLIPAGAMAGTLESPAAPSDPASALYSTDEIYNRLQSGTAGAKRTGGFTEPTAGPVAGARKSLDEIMSVAPVADNVNGLKSSEAPSGKTFWGLNPAGGGWGPRTGTNPNVVDTTEAAAPAAANNIIPGKKAFVNGAVITGAMPSVVFTCNGTLNGTRWCDRGNGTIQDMTTGLIWLKNANCTTTLNGVAKPSGALTWDNARIWSTSLVSGQCGLSDGSTEGDWRLPTKNELASLANGNEPVRSATPRNFSGVQFGYYWPSTTYLNNQTYAWAVYLYDGYETNTAKTSSTFVWPVRGGQ